MSETITVLPRDVNAITTEIRTITRQTQQIILTAAVEIGRRLAEAKELVPYGQWGDYLKNEVEFSQSTANNFMRMYEEYGNGQKSLFDTANSQTLGNLPYTKALRLLAMPKEEREDFVAEHDVEGMSTRELDKAIRELEEAKEETARLEVELAQTESKEKASAQQALEAERLANAMKARAETAEKAAKDAEKLRADLAKAVAAKKTAEEKLKQAQQNPNIPETTLETMRREAEAAAAENAAKLAQEKLTAAEKKTAEAEKARLAAEEKLAAARKTAQLADPDGAVFKEIFSQVQGDFNRLLETLRKIQGSNPELGHKLQNATLRLLDKLRSEAEG